MGLRVLSALRSKVSTCPRIDLQIGRQAMINILLGRNIGRRQRVNYAWKTSPFPLQGRGDPSTTEEPRFVTHRCTVMSDRLKTRRD